MMKKIAVLLLALLLLSGCVADELAVTTEETTTGSESAANVDESEDDDTSSDTEPMGPFEVFTTEDLYGSEVTQEVFADADLTVINIWGTFCGPCINEMPDLAELSEEYAAQSVKFIGLVGDAYDSEGKIDEGIVATAKEIVDQTGASYLHLLPENELLYNVMTQISAFPTTVFVDSEGKQVDYTYLGAADKETWASRIDTALELVKSDE